MKSAAASGPIIIVNVTEIRSDAIIITKDALVLFPLPAEFKYCKVQEYVEADLTSVGDIVGLGKRNTKYRRLQKWLWQNCVNPIFKRLAMKDLGYSLKKFQVWWIPIGIASVLPFHAAGIYTGPRDTGHGRETALERAISSYTPTLKILIHGREKLKNNSDMRNLRLLSKDPAIPKARPRQAVIIMPSTPGEEDLEGVEREAEDIQTIVQDVYSTKILRQPSAKVTIAHMAESDIVHYAGHGTSDSEDPSSSHLLLQIMKPGCATPAIELTVRDVAAANVSRGKLAFLSACSTAQITDTTLWDETLHLVSGFHIAGYMHAIGNLWPSEDEVSAQVVKKFYMRLLELGDFGNGENTAAALNKAMIDVAAEHANKPLSWAQLVHYGV